MVEIFVFSLTSYIIWRWRGAQHIDWGQSSPISLVFWVGPYCCGLQWTYAWWTCWLVSIVGRAEMRCSLLQLTMSIVLRPKQVNYLSLCTTTHPLDRCRRVPTQSQINPWYLQVFRATAHEMLTQACKFFMLPHTMLTLACSDLHMYSSPYIYIYCCSSSDSLGPSLWISLLITLKLQGFGSESHPHFIMLQSRHNTTPTGTAPEGQGFPD
jgi:hypothetical protein